MSVPQEGESYDLHNALVYKDSVSFPCPRCLIRKTIFQKQIATVYYTFLIICNSQY